MKFTSALTAVFSLSAVVLAQETSVSGDVTYVDVTVTPEVTSSVVSTVLSTSTPFTTKTVGIQTYKEDNSTESTSHTVAPFSAGAVRADALGSLVGVGALMAALL